MRICARMPLNYEFSLCGDSFDIAGDIEGSEDFRMADDIKQNVNCENCKAILKEIYETYTPTGRLKDAPSN